MHLTNYAVTIWVSKKQDFWQESIWFKFQQTTQRANNEQGTS